MASKDEREEKYDELHERMERLLDEYDLVGGPGGDYVRALNGVVEAARLRIGAFRESTGEDAEEDE